ncbi:MFS transporter [Anaerocolumna aminovalerica]|uniref:MFS transporter n=1 Tax=Anaerocolumna aminovalerica TaxID=1527 RepID=UPI000BE24686|nr:MFS transporter [Anaerocolumna aminovalerica]
MYTKLKRIFRQIYFNSNELTEEEYKRGQKKLILSGLTANMISLLTTGTFLVGYLSYLGASERYIAIIGAIPQLGCILQMFSPYIFEKLKHRKLLICICCFLFRFSVGTIIFVPYVLHKKVSQLMVIMIIYSFAYLAAGFVTPGLNNWNMSITPVRGRGRFLAIKDITSMFGVAAASLMIGRMLDYYKVNNKYLTGFTIIFLLALVISILDFMLLSGIGEPINIQQVHNSSLFQMISRPLKDLHFRKVIFFLSIWYFAIHFSVSFISIYMVNSLELSYSFISVVGVLGNIFGMVSIYLWGSLADKTSWNFLLKTSGIIIAFCYMGWAFVTVNNALILVPVFQILLTGSNGAFNMAAVNIQYAYGPESGKTAYLGVTQSIAYVTGFFGGILGAAASQLLKNLRIEWKVVSIGNIQILFLITSLILFTALGSIKIKK